MATTTQIEIDSALVASAANSGLAFGRTAAGQIEHWAALGRIADAIFTKERTDTLAQIGMVSNGEELLSGIDSPEAVASALKEIGRGMRKPQ